jgi:hypothetical protein
VNHVRVVSIVAIESLAEFAAHRDNASIKLEVGSI